MSSRDRITPVDPVRVPRPSSPDTDDERTKREAVSALRKVGAQQGQSPAGAYRPRQDTIRENPPPAHGHAADAPFGRPAPSLPPASADPRDGVMAALRAENEALRSGRKKTPERGIPATPEHTSVEDAKTEPAITDAAIGRGVRHLLKRFWPLLLGAAGLGAGGAGALKPAAAPEKLDAAKVQLAALKGERDGDRDVIDGLVKREALRDRYIECLEEEFAEVAEQTTPAPDSMRARSLPRPFVERCSRLRP